uniref:Uncharacterized protein n=1 Tax=Ananas comosus var. bracteatus TaxID=296719 RepID=A0A6V7QL93_ANACO|nr:unnamed protein product [Ananas comosus var. bracteatus]
MAKSVSNTTIGRIWPNMEVKDTVNGSPCLNAVNCSPCLDTVNESPYAASCSPPYRATSIPPLLLRSHLRHIASILLPSLRFHLQSHLLPLMPLRSYPHPFNLGLVPSIPSVADLGCFCRRLDFVTILLKKGFFHAVCINCQNLYNEAWMVSFYAAEIIFSCCLAGAEPNGPVVVIIPTLGMSLAHGNPLRRPIPPPKNSNLHQPGLGSFRPEGPVSPTWDRSLSLPPKIQRSGTGLSLRGTGLSPRRRARGPVSTARTGCLAGHAALFTGGPVSPLRDRSPRVKLSGLCQNSRDRTFRPVYHRRLSTKCGKVQNTNRTLEPRNLQRSSVLHTTGGSWRGSLK